MKTLLIILCLFIVNPNVYGSEEFDKNNALLKIYYYTYIIDYCGAKNNYSICVKNIKKSLQHKYICDGDNCKNLSDLVDSKIEDILLNINKSENRIKTKEEYFNLFKFFIIFVNNLELNQPNYKDIDSGVYIGKKLTR